MTIKSYKAPISGRIIFLNTDTQNVVLLGDIRKEEIKEFVRLYEEKRISEFWHEFILQIAPSTDKLNGFEIHERTPTSGASSGPRYLKTEFLQNILSSTSSGKKLLAEMGSLSISQQKKLLTVNMPKSRNELINAVRDIKGVLAHSFLEILDDSVSAEEFINKISLTLTNSNKTNRSHHRCFELLTFLWDNNVVLFPTDLRQWVNNNKWSILCNSAYCQNKQNIAMSIYVPPEALGYADKSLTFAITALACSSIRFPEDITPDLVYDFENIAAANLRAFYSSDSKARSLVSDTGRLRTTTLAFLKMHNRLNPGAEVELERKARKSRWGDNRSRTDGNFLWLSEDHPELTEWAETFHLFTKSRTTARVSTVIDVLNYLGDFLCTLESPPLAPWLIDRRTHIYDATLVNNNTYFEYLLKHSTTTKRRNRNISTLRGFFSWIRDYLDATNRQDLSLFPEPILLSDSLGKELAPAKTHRDSLPPYIINEMKGALIENDFEFPKAHGRSLAHVLDNETGYHVRVFYPGLAICMYTLLDTPIRSHQARWLDSGQLDEFIYNPSKGKYEVNTSKFAIHGRNESVLRMQKDGLRAEESLVMWVNTNKTGAYDKANNGYIIPYVSPKLSKLLDTQLKWQVRYFAEPAEPISYRIYQDDVRELSRQKIVAGPDVCPLFRDPGRADSRLPFDYQKLTRFYSKLLENTQQRIYSKYGQKLKLVSKDEDGKLKWVVDLHSLRVSGITNLIEAGVPLEVVQMFVVGHQVLVSTLHYLKYSPAKLRQFLEIAHERMINDQDFVGSEIFAQSLEELAPFLLTPEGPGMGAGIDALMLGDGIWTINPDGICPGTSCSTGGVLEVPAQNKYGPVPGGQRCGLCRYWVTGPAHILGQITAVNNLAYVIRKKGQEIAKLNEQCLDAEDKGEQKEARRLRDRVDLLNRELEIDINEWASRYQFAQQSLLILQDYIEAKRKIIATDKNVPIPFLTRSDALELKITMQQSHEFALLDQITQMSKFTTGFSNTEAEIDKHQILSKMMVANGIHPFLLTLNEEQAHEAGNLLSSLILQKVDSSCLSDVLTGTKPLSEFPALDNAIQRLALEASSENSLQKENLNRIAQLLDEKDVDVTSPDEQQGEDEDLFG